MNPDEQLVQEADLALVRATEKYLDASPWDRAALRPHLDKARKGWADARYRLLFPGSITVAQDVAEAKALRDRIDEAADRQSLIQALIDLASLLIKFAH
jgi:hypothetical protein